MTPSRIAAVRLDDRAGLAQTLVVTGASYVSAEGPTVPSTVGASASSFRSLSPPRTTALRI